MASIRTHIRAISPRWIVETYRAVATGREFIRDYAQYVSSSAWHARPNARRGWRDSRESYESRLTINYHGLEKGATLPAPKRPYGESKVKTIEDLLDKASSYGMDLDGRGHALATVQAVENFNNTGTISDTTSPRADRRVLPWNSDDFRSFVQQRHSIRNFDPDRDVALASVREAVAIASDGTPSVCNRRSYRAHFYSDRATISDLLALQNGNRGFGHTVRGLFIVTERRSAFVGAGERNQRWIDGGLFAMTLVYALHAAGFGTCFLNWSQTNRQTALLRMTAGIPRSEDVIVLIAVGYPPNTFRVASSPSRPIDDTFVVH